MQCALTVPLLEESFKVIKAWGFTYKTVAFTWVKRCKKNTGSFHVGMGHWTRANAEICLFAVKGRPKRVSKSVRQIIDSPIEAHSKKPEEARDKILRLIGDIPRVELFARQTTPGWDVWGNEVECDITF